MQTFSITGTFHGAFISAFSEGMARAAFHRKYNGESIIAVRNSTTGKWLQNSSYSDCVYW